MDARSKTSRWNCFVRSLKSLSLISNADACCCSTRLVAATTEPIMVTAAKTAKIFGLVFITYVMTTFLIRLVEINHPNEVLT